MREAYNIREFGGLRGRSGKIAKKSTLLSIGLLRNANGHFEEFDWFFVVMPKL